MNENISLTKLIPKRYRDNGVKTLNMTPAAHAQIKAAAAEVGVDDIDNLLRMVAHSAGSFVTSDYFAASKWFNEYPLHPFKAVRFECHDGTIVEPILVIEPKSGMIYAESEKTLPEDYPVRRVIEESKAEVVLEGL